MKTSSLSWLLIILMMTFVMLTGCETAAEEQVTIRLALLPIVDSLPVHAALQEGYFEAHNLQVEVIPVASAPERDQLVAAGRAEGMINELVSTMFFNRQEERVQIIRTARAATDKQAVFRILAAPDAGVKTPDDLKGVDIGISEGTVIEYLTDRLLTAEGLSEDEIKKVAVPRISDRLSLLASGELPAAVLPDPLASLAIQEGAVVVLDDSSYPEYGLSVYTFRNEFLRAHPQAVRGFLLALEKAVGEINNQPEKYNGLLMEKELVPTQLLEDYHVPVFPLAAVPDRSQWADALGWALDRELLESELEYQNSVNGNYLP